MQVNTDNLKIRVKADLASEVKWTVDDAISGYTSNKNAQRIMGAAITQAKRKIRAINKIEAAVKAAEVAGLDISL